MSIQDIAKKYGHEIVVNDAKLPVVDNIKNYCKTLAAKCKAWEREANGKTGLSMATRNEIIQLANKLGVSTK